jgi:protein TonB
LASAETIVRAEAPSAIARSPGDEPPRFVMVFGQAASARAVVGAASAHRGSATGEDAILPVEDATTPARLLASFPPHYPIAARANGIEADVRLELVVDSEGRVQSTRVLGPRNGDFDAAALDAVARYRFAPATFRGRPARVRMKWSVEFRLK